MSYYIYVPYIPIYIDVRTGYPMKVYYAHSPYYDYRYYPNSPYPPYSSYEEDVYEKRQGECREAARINATMDYVNGNLENQGYHGGTPNFHQRTNESGQLVYGIIAFKKDAVIHDPGAALGNIDRRNVGEMMRAAANYASSQGYGGAGIPTFHIGPNVYGVLLFKRGTAEVVDVTARELGNPRGVEQLFRAVANYARSKNYGGAGFPNFHQRRREDGVLVYGVILIKPGNTDVLDVLAKNLNLPEYVERFCGPPLTGPIVKNGGFEDHDAHWQTSYADIYSNSHSGKKSARLEAYPRGGVADIIQNITLDPNRAHKAIFYAISTSSTGRIKFSLDNIFNKSWGITSKNFLTWEKLEFIIPKGVGEGKRNFKLKISLENSADNQIAAYASVDDVSINPV